MKKIILTTIGLCAISTFNASAGQSEQKQALQEKYESERCDINLEGELNFAEDTLTITTESNEKVKITDTYMVYVNDKKLTLSDQETKWVQAYYDGIEETIPQVMTVAAEGIKIANYAVTEVLRGFLGNDSRVAAQLETKMNDLYTKLNEHVYQNPKSLTFNTETLEKELGLGADFDAEVDQIMSEVMENAMGEFLVQMGRSMLNGEGSMTTFEQRMEKMGEQIESTMESQTDGIKKEAEKLCDMLTSVEVAESKVQTIKGLSGVDLLVKK